MAAENGEDGSTLDPVRPEQKHVVGLILFVVAALIPKLMTSTHWLYILMSLLNTSAIYVAACSVIGSALLAEISLYFIQICAMVSTIAVLLFTTDGDNEIICVFTLTALVICHYIVNVYTRAIYTRWFAVVEIPHVAMAAYFRLGQMRKHQQVRQQWHQLWLPIVIMLVLIATIALARIGCIALPQGKHLREFSRIIPAIVFESGSVQIADACFPAAEMGKHLSDERAQVGSTMQVSIQEIGHDTNQAVDDVLEIRGVSDTHHRVQEASGQSVSQSGNVVSPSLGPLGDQMPSALKEEIKAEDKTFMIEVLSAPANTSAPPAPIYNTGPVHRSLRDHISKAEHCGNSGFHSKTDGCLSVRVYFESGLIALEINAEDARDMTRAEVKMRACEKHGLSFETTRMVEQNPSDESVTGFRYMQSCNWLLLVDPPRRHPAQLTTPTRFPPHGLFQISG